jgi:hypothetical protein
MKKQLLTAVCGLFLTVGAANAQIVVRIGPPPPRPVEVVPAPREGFVWVHGHYAHPPHRGAVWYPGEWREEQGGHVWHEGYWR